MMSSRTNLSVGSLETVKPSGNVQISTSSQPRSILKKPTSPKPKISSSPQFYSGNEFKEANCGLRESGSESDFSEPDCNSLIYNTEKRITVHPHKGAVSTRRKKTSSSDSTERDEDSFEDIETEEKVRFSRSTTRYLKKSSLANRKQRSQKSVKRQPSIAYILNNKQIDAEVMNCFRESICGFIDEFKHKMNIDGCEDNKLLASSDFVLRSEFLEQLRQYLCDEQSLESIYEKNLHEAKKSFSKELGVSLSEPVMGRDQLWRARSQVAKISSSHSSIALDHDRLKRFDFNGDPKKVLEKGNMEQIISGSLPVKSNMDMYMKTLRHQHERRMKLEDLRDSEMRKSSSGSLHGSVSSSKCIVSTATANKKAVRFADAFGLDLASVRIITNNSFMFASTASDLDNLESTSYSGAGGGSSCEFGSSSIFNAISVPFLVLIPLFSIRRPLNNEFVIKLEEYLFDYENQIVKCIAKVRNLSFEKRVFARITFNSWRTHYDLDAMYLRPDNTQPNQFDSFGFCIIIPEKSLLVSSSSLFGGSSGTSGKMDDCFCRIEFALCCQQGGNEFWDNNGGENYKFQCFYNIKS